MYTVIATGEIWEKGFDSDSRISEPSSSLWDQSLGRQVFDWLINEIAVVIDYCYHVKVTPIRSLTEHNSLTDLWDQSAYSSFGRHLSILTSFSTSGGNQYIILVEHSATGLDDLLIK